ncbi:MAG: cell division protein FtsL [Candidatus Azotimanducaceae bacterium]
MGQNLTVSTVLWLLMWRQLAVGLMLALVLVSAFGVSLSAHMTRQLFASIQTANLKSDELDSEYEKLLLEQSAWSGYTRLDQLAREELHMRTPLTQNMVIVER